MVKDANAHLCGRIPLRISGIFNTPGVVLQPTALLAFYILISR